MDILKILREKLYKSKTREEKESYQKLLHMYENNVEIDNLALIDKDILAVYPKPLIPQALAKAKALTGNPMLKLEQFLAYRPQRTYTQEDMSFDPNSLRNICRKPNNTQITCDICGTQDFYTVVRSKLCLNCFCREISLLIEAYKEKGKELKFNDAALWVNNKTFPRDKLFELATILHIKLRNRQKWNAIADVFENKNINIGRWTRY